MKKLLTLLIFTLATVNAFSTSYNHLDGIDRFKTIELEITSLKGECDDAPLGASCFPGGAYVALQGYLPGCLSEVVYSNIQKKYEDGKWKIYALVLVKMRVTNRPVVCPAVIRAHKELVHLKQQDGSYPRLDSIELENLKVK